MNSENVLLLPKRVLICASRVSHIINFHMPYIRYFKESGFTVDIAVQGRTDNPLIDNCYDLNFTKNPFSPDNIATVHKLRKIILQNHYDIVYSNSTLAGTAVKLALTGFRNNKPYFVHISHGYMFGEKQGFRSSVYLAVEKFTGYPVDKLVVMNREDYYMAKKYRLGKDIHYINGMGLCGENFPEISLEMRESFRKSIGAQSDTALLLCVGEFSQRKNQALLIEALNILEKKHKNILLAFAGEGKTLDECKMLVQKYELDTNVRFLGHIQDMNLLYRSADLVVSVSKMEGLPFNVLESLYCGIPVVASDIKGHSDIIQNEVNGLLSENTAEGTADKIDRILSDRDFYDRLKENAFLDEKYLIQNAMPVLIGILDKDYENRENVYGRTQQVE